MKDKWVEEAMKGAWQSIAAYACTHLTPLLPLICDTFARRILCAPTKLLSLLSKSKITPPNFWGSNLKFLG